jgi:glucose/arabinose dehydrogenase
VRFALALFLLAVALVLAACDGDGGDAAKPAPGERTIATGLDVPWGIAFLPGGDALVSERQTGRILRISANGGRKRVVMRVPGVDTASGEGGLLGLAVSAAYRRDRWVYAYFTTASDNRIVRFRLGEPVHPILTGLRRGEIHDGGRIGFGPDGKLYATVGETGDAPLAQNLRSLNGKILRMNPDGSVPRGNPFGNSLVWTWGHRNVEGIAWDARGRLWASEFGESSFDELNLIRPGRNYGWPDVEGKGPTDGGRFTNPVLTWRTDEASPSGVAIRGQAMFIGALRGEDLLRVALRGTSAVKRSPLLRGRYGRIRTVVRAPDGSIWIATSNRDGRGEPRRGDDRIVRIASR